MALAKPPTRAHRLSLPQKLRLQWRTSFFSRLPWLFMAASLMLGLPFLLAGFQSFDSLFLSNQHANLVEKALIAVDRGRLELIGFVYPPLPFLLLLPSPTPLLTNIVGALLAGATAWLIWLRLTYLPFPPALRILLVIIPLATPSLIFLATQSVAEMLLMLLMVCVWDRFVAFTQSGSTRSGFLAGLLLGLAFLVSPYAALYGLAFAVSVPLFIRERRYGAAIAGAIVLAFPVLIAILAWSYINWVFTGNPFYFLNNPYSSIFVYGRPSTEAGLIVGWQFAFRSTLQDLALAPLYLMTFFLMALLRPRRLLVFLAPLVMITTVRAFGLVYPDYLAVSTYTILALAALPRQTPRTLAPILLLAAGLQLWLGYTTPLKDEVANWGQVMVSGQSIPNDREEQAIAEYLAVLPPRSILLNDRDGYRIVARAGTARPFLLPADALYPLAFSQPAAFVAYVLMPAQQITPQDEPIFKPNTIRPPAGFQVKMTWPHWILYERIT